MGKLYISITWFQLENVIPQCWLLCSHQITNNDRLSTWFDMAAEATVSISDFTRLSISPLNNIKPTFTESVAYLPDGEKWLLWPICKLEYLIREGEKSHYSRDQEWKEPCDNPQMMNLWRKKKRGMVRLTKHNLLLDKVNAYSWKQRSYMWTNLDVL